MRKIILASGSKSRKELLEKLGLKFEVKVGEYEEDMTAFSDPCELAKFLSLGKVKDVAKHYDDAVIIGGDSFIIFENKFIGKPKDEKMAFEILKNFSGKEHKAISGFAIIDTKNGKIINDFGEASVKFRNLTDEEIWDYIAVERCLELAGAYGMLEKAAPLIESINGDVFSIIGFPLNKIYLGLKEMGVNVYRS